MPSARFQFLFRNDQKGRANTVNETYSHLQAEHLHGTVNRITLPTNYKIDRIFPACSEV